MKVHICDQPGLTMHGIHIEEIRNGHGQHYWKAKAKIGTIFGAEVEGELEAIGATKDQAITRLEKQREELYESLWY